MKKPFSCFVACGAVALSLVAPVARAASNEHLPAQQIIAAIRTAVAAYPGEIKEVEVDEKRGRLIVEVTIIGADGAKKEVQVDPATNQVVR